MSHSPIKKYGLLGGIAVVVYFLIAYWAGREYFLLPTVQWAAMVIYLVMMYRAAVEDVAQNGISRDFRTLSRTPFAVFLLINVAYWLFYYALHLYDPQLLAMETDLKIRSLQAQLDAGVGDPERAHQLRDEILRLRNENIGVQPLSPILLQMGVGALGGFVLSVGIVGILKMKG